MKKVDLAFTQVRGERFAYNYSPSGSIIDPLYMFKYKRPFPDEKWLDLFFFFTHVSKQQNGFSQPTSGNMYLSSQCSIQWKILCTPT